MTLMQVLLARCSHTLGAAARNRWFLEKSSSESQLALVPSSIELSEFRNILREMIVCQCGISSLKISVSISTVHLSPMPNLQEPLSYWIALFSELPSMESPKMSGGERKLAQKPQLAPKPPNFLDRM
jgi:hypothetical protein